MQPTIKLLALAAGIALVAANPAINFCENDSCGGTCSSQNVPGDGACRQLERIKSASTQSVDAGCTSN